MLKQKRKYQLSSFKVLIAAWLVTFSQTLMLGAHDVSAITSQKILISGDGWGNFRSIDANGTNPMALGKGEFAEASPDGLRIVFSASSDLYIQNQNREIVNITNTPSSVESHASWSPDGQHILYKSYTQSTNTGGYYVMNADGSNAQPVLPNALSASYSPDGTQIVSSQRNQSGIGTHIAISNADGTNLVSIYSASNASDPTWSPNGQYIAWTGTCWNYVTNQMNATCVSIMNTDGSSNHIVYNPTAPNQPVLGIENPKWAQDSAHLLTIGRENDGSGQDFLSLISADTGLGQRFYTGRVAYATWAKIDTSYQPIDQTPPSIKNPSISPPLVIGSGTINVSAEVTDDLGNPSSDSGINYGEFYLDSDPGKGNGTPMAYGYVHPLGIETLAATEQINGSRLISPTNTSAGAHTLYIRVKDNAGNWSGLVSEVLLKL